MSRSYFENKMLHDIMGEWSQDDKELAKFAVDKFNSVSIMFLLHFLLNTTEEPERSMIKDGIIKAWRSCMEEDMSNLLEKNKVLSDSMIGDLFKGVLEDTSSLHERLDRVLAQVEDLLRAALIVPDSPDLL